MQRKHVKTPPQRRWLLVIITCLSAFMSTAQTSYSQTPVYHTQRPSIDKQTHAQAQEAFVQQLISGTLNQNKTSKHIATVSSGQRQAGGTNHSPLPLTVGMPEVSATPNFTSATTTMVIALAIILSLLALGAYLIRRYLLKTNLFGQGEPTLRVRTRVNLSPKAAVTLLEVPGTLLIIGTAGGNLIPLGEVPTANAEDFTPSENSPKPSFSAVLDEQSRTLQGSEMADDSLLRMPEEIQRKVSRLKQL